MAKTRYLDIKVPIVRLDWRAPMIKVTPKSPIKQRTAAYEIGKFFHKEMKTDFPPYSKEGEVNSIVHLYLDFQGAEVTKNDKWDIPAKAAVCFRYDHISNYDQHFRYLDWIWIHPYDRGKFDLEIKFQDWIDEYGHFLIHTPYSKAMTRFLEKINYPLDPDEVVKLINQ